MGKMLLGLTASLAASVISIPASAGTPEEPFVGIPNAKGAIGTFGGDSFAGGGFSAGLGHPGFGDRHFNRSGRRGHNSIGIWVNGGEWAKYNNETFKSDSYNDWWHDRPDRAYPAWMQHNQRCEKLWYSGSTLRC